MLFQLISARVTSKLYYKKEYRIFFFFLGGGGGWFHKDGPICGREGLITGGLITGITVCLQIDAYNQGGL